MVLAGRYCVFSTMTDCMTRSMAVLLLISFWISLIIVRHVGFKREIERRKKQEQQIRSKKHGSIYIYTVGDGEKKMKNNKALYIDVLHVGPRGGRERCPLARLTE